MEVTATQEWADYVSEPGPERLSKLLQAAGAATDELVAALVDHERSTSAWRIAHHLAILFTKLGYARVWNAL